MTKQDRIAKLEAELARLKNDNWPKTTVIYVHEEDLFTEAEELGLEESAEEVFAHSLYELGLEVQVHSSGKTLLVSVQDGDTFVPLARPIVLAEPEMFNALGAATIQSLENQQKFKTLLFDINERLKSIEKKLDIGQKS